MSEVARPASSRIALDALRVDDAAMLHRWRRDPEIGDGALSYPFPTTIDAEVEWIRGFEPRRTPSDLCMAIRDLDSDDLLGYVQLRGIDWIARVAEFGIVIGPSSQRGTGLGKQALLLTRRYAVDTLGLRRLWLRVAAYNQRAIRLYENTGFNREGHLQAHAFRNGGLHDVFIYAWAAS